MRRRRRQSGGPSLAVFVVIGAVLVAAGAGWLLLRRGAESPEPQTVAAAAASSAESPAATDAGIPALDLPELSASDAFIRDVISGLSAHPQLARWLVTDQLVNRFVGSVVDLAGGQSPRSRLEFLIPEQKFAIRESGEDLVIDTASYRRYDLLTEVITSLDTQGTARLFVQLHPLFDEAYAELGIPEGTFDDAMTLAVGNLLAAQVPTGPVEVRQSEAVYEFADPAIEARSPAEKHLIRLGPENATRVQAKLRELRDAIAAASSTAR